MVGWDCMITTNKEYVFFEGNFALYRINRRIFASAEILTEFVFRQKSGKKIPWQLLNKLALNVAASLVVMYGLRYFAGLFISSRFSL